ncbi:hypothetical protein ACKKBG_A25475 [Auxenochlorella protothecoides x Auxenochlorella symbiontica]
MTGVETLSPEADSQTTTSPAQEATGKLFLGGLSWDTNEDTLREHFQKYGDIREAVVMRDRQTSRPRGFGFVTFEKSEVADAVVQETHVVDGRQIDAKKSVPLEQKPKARKIFVGGLAPETTEEAFKIYFEQFGEVVEAQIMQDHMSGRSRGFGFVTFAEDVSAERVFAAGAMHELRGKRVEVKPATPKGSGVATPAAPAPARIPRPIIYPSHQGPFPFVTGHPTASYAYGVYGYPPPGTPHMLPAGSAYGMQYHPNPYVMMQQVPYGAAPAPAGAYTPPVPGSPYGGPSHSLRIAKPPSVAAPAAGGAESAATATPTSQAISDLRKLNLD